MKKEEVRAERNSPELVRRQWSDGEFADEDPISPDTDRERKRTGGIEGKKAEQQ
jgi:hypothetical protein